MFDIIIKKGKKESFIKIVNNKLVGYSLLDGKKYPLTNEDINILNNFKLSIDLKKLESFDGYDVYLDNKTGFKHYFKDKQEDFNMFCLNNGTSAIFSSDEKKDNNKEKVFKFNMDKAYDVTLRVLTVMLIVSGFTLIQLDYQSYKEQHERYQQSLYDIAQYNLTDSGNILSYESIADYINESPYLTDEDKALFNNEKLLNDVIPYYEGTNMEYLFNERFKDLRIDYYDELPEEVRDISIHSVGWYHNLDMNVINVLNRPQNEKELKGVKTHEYVHLLQNSDYMYLVEPSAELISYEYYDCPILAYEDELINLKFLLETVGPEPIWEVNFANDDTKLRTIINNNLSPEKASKLIELLQTKYEDYSDDIHNEIRFLLYELHENIYHEKWYGDKAIVSLFTNSIRDRYYFNSDKINNITPYYITLQDINDHESVYFLKEFAFRKDLTYEEYLNLSKYDILQSKIKFFAKPGCTINGDKVSWKDVDYTFEEAIEQGLLSIKLMEDIFYLEPNEEVVNIYIENKVPFQIISVLKGDYMNKGDKVKEIENGILSDNEIAVELPNIYVKFPEQNKEEEKVIAR